MTATMTTPILIETADTGGRTMPLSMVVCRTGARRHRRPAHRAAPARQRAERAVHRRHPVRVPGPRTRRRRPLPGRRRALREPDARRQVRRVRARDRRAHRHLPTADRRPRRRPALRQPGRPDDRAARQPSCSRPGARSPAPSTSLTLETAFLEAVVVRRAQVPRQLDPARRSSARACPTTTAASSCATPSHGSSRKRTSTSAGRPTRSCSWRRRTPHTQPPRAPWA